ncbi:MAG: hypothetical protein MUE69_08900 [Myxococcota bacterium]|nr:hypothetical protein [Myxococcota bacterium]
MSLEIGKNGPAMGDDDQGGGLGGRLSIPMAGVPVPEDDEDGFARLSGLELDDELDALDALDALDPDAGLDDVVDSIATSNPPPRMPPVSVRPLPPRAPLPVKRPGSASSVSSASSASSAPSAPRERVSNEPPVAFPPPSSEPPPGRGSGIDFEKVLATASMSPPPKPDAPTLDLAMAPPAPSMPVAPRSGGAARTVGLVVLAAAAAFAVAWFLRAPEPEPTLSLGPIAGAPTSATTNTEPSGASGAIEAPERAATEPSAIEASEGSENEPAGNDEPDAIPTDDSSSSEAETTRADATDTTRTDGTDTTRSDTTRTDGTDTTRTDGTDTTRADTTRSDTTRSDTTRSDTTRADGTDTTRADTTRADTTRADTTRAVTTRADTTRADTTRSDTTRATPELVRVEPPPPVAPPPPSADLPEEPTRDEVQAALSAIRPAVQSCVQPGAQVRVRITIANSGRVTTAVVEDDYWSRQPHGGCIARAVRTASFPRFARDRFVVVFPFQF